MPHSYAPQFRAMVIEQLRRGRKVSEIAQMLEVSEATIYRWWHQDRIDRGEEEGVPTSDRAELRAAKKRIAELEQELEIVKKASELFKEGRVVRPKQVFKIVEVLAKQGHGAKRVCRILAIAPSGFFRWKCHPPSDRAIRRAWLTDLILEIHDRSRRTYGHRRIRAELLDSYGQRVNRKLVRAIMTERGICGLPRRRRGKPNPANRATTEDLVNREFAREGPNQLWMTDITEHPTREGKLYCCVVLDAFSRRIVGWSIDHRPTTAMVNSALGMAIESRRPSAGTLVHSDHGSQYTSWTFSQKIRSAGLAQSIGTVGDAFDNAVVESFWARMQTELLDTRRWKTRVELSAAIFDWIEAFYNRTRRHSSLGMLAPITYEKLHAQPTTAA